MRVRMSLDASDIDNPDCKSWTLIGRQICARRLLDSALKTWTPFNEAIFGATVTTQNSTKVYDTSSSNHSYKPGSEQVLHWIFLPYNSDNSGMMRHSTRTHVTRRRQERNNVIISTAFPGLLAVYCMRDIFTIDVTPLEFRRSPVAGEGTEETCKEILSTNADATEKMQPIAVQLASGMTFAITSRS